MEKLKIENEDDILSFLEGCLSDLRKAQSDLTQAYRSQKDSSSFKDSHLKAYLLTRFPAIYKVLEACLTHFPENYVPQSWLDLGAGPGTVFWTIHQRWPHLDCTLIEQHPLMIKFGEEILERAHLARKPSYHLQTIEGFLKQNKNIYDVVSLSYVLGEIKNPLKLIQDIWEITEHYCLIAAPGTPFDFRYLKEIRQWWIEKGGGILAPCTHFGPCLSRWCHFSVHVSRTKSHSIIKNAKLNYEFEKYSFLTLSKEKASEGESERIIAKPQKRSGHIRFTTCSYEGIKERIISSKNKNQLSLNKNKKWGDLFE